MQKIVERGSAEDVAHDPIAAGKRYGRSPQTVSKHWPASCGFPPPDFFAGRTPFWYLSTLQRWEAGQGHSKYRRARGDAGEAA